VTKGLPNLGTIISTVVILLGLAVSWGSQRTELAYLKEAVIKMESKIDTLEESVSDLKGRLRWGAKRSNGSN
jgi:hypothetical protein